MPRPRGGDPVASDSTDDHQDRSGGSTVATRGPLHRFEDGEQVRRKLSLVILIAVAVATTTPVRASARTMAIECGTAHSTARAGTIAAPAADPDPDPQAPLGVGLQVDTKGVTVLPELVTKRVRKQAELRARDAGVAIVERGRASIKVAVRSTPKALGFEYAVTAQLDGRLVPVDDREGRCDPCTHEDVVRRIDELLVRQYEALQLRSQQLEDAAASPAPASEPAASRTPPEGATPHEPPSPASAPTDRAASPSAASQRKPTAPLGAIGGAGIAIGAVGLAGVVAGAVLATRPAQRERVPGDAGAFREVDRDTGGFALVGVGAALVAGGIAMVVTDVVFRKRRRTAAAAVLNSRLVGFSVSGRF
ncbi:MAG: hypothetical protein KBB21_34290 [Nannocystaceae bacterium]|nr:hypothetical protein [Deltaproteobacteria bacterium]MBP7291747.1 hypothetical protein [Nannocystaceae bacterium]